jgi:hypothetical protein
MRFPPEQTVIQLIQTLLTSTRSGNVTWSPISGDAFGCLFDQGGVYIASVDRDERPPWEFGFLDVDGDVVDQFHTRFEDIDVDDDTINAVHLLGDLFEVARASALNTDFIVSSLLALLSSDSRESIASHQLPMTETNTRPEKPDAVRAEGPSTYVFDEEPF